MVAVNIPATSEHSSPNHAKGLTHIAALAAIHGKPVEGRHLIQDSRSTPLDRQASAGGPTCASQGIPSWLPPKTGGSVVLDGTPGRAF
jgi:hypothetical protein